nr:restriction system-associated AAA family ATPase [Desulfobacula sp.]
MILLRLKINEPFRCLQAGFELYFQNDWDRTESRGGFAPYVLAGPNGSGKSNVLEVLAAIFYHLQCQYLTIRPQGFDYDEEENPGGFRDERSVPDAFELEYLTFPPVSPEYGDEKILVHIRIVKVPGSSARVYLLNHPDVDADTPLPRTEAAEMLPEHVIAYSSGENEILSLPFFKMRFINYDAYLYHLTRQSDYPEPEGRMTFLDSQMSQALLICNFLFQDEPSLEPFKTDVGVKGLKQFRIIIRQHRRVEYNVELLEEFERSRTEFPFGTEVELTSAFKKNVQREDGSVRRIGVIDRLAQCATCSFMDEETESLILDYWVTPETRTAFKNHFSSILDLFQSFQALIALNLYPVSDAMKKALYRSASLYVNETVPILPLDERVIRFEDLILLKEGVNAPVYAKSLSDGEHQFLHTLGLCLLFKNKNALFLLDEPETHFNPDWRSKLISRIRDCFGMSYRKTKREMLITTHTPFLISDSRPENVLVFKKEDQSVTVSRPDYNTLGASINKITMKTFGKKETIGGYADRILNDMKQRFATGENREALLEEVHQKLGDSIEKILFTKTLLDSMEKDET